MTGITISGLNASVHQRIRSLFSQPPVKLFSTVKEIFISFKHLDHPQPTQMSSSLMRPVFHISIWIVVAFSDTLQLRARRSHVHHRRLQALGDAQQFLCTYPPVGG